MRKILAVFAFLIFPVAVLAGSPLTLPCVGTRDMSQLVPEGAIWRQQNMRRAIPPMGFTFVLGWINVATVEPCLDSGPKPEITLRKIRLIERFLGKDTVIKTVDFTTGQAGFEGRLFPRIPKWFGETEGDGDGIIDQWSAGSYHIDMSQATQRVYHGWTDPRSPAKPGAMYFVEVEAKISGSARLQLGVDYWPAVDTAYGGYSKDCSNLATNCEGWISNWFGDSGGVYKTFRAPNL